MFVLNMFVLNIFALCSSSSNIRSKKYQVTGCSCYPTIHHILPARHTVVFFSPSQHEQFRQSLRIGIGFYFYKVDKARKSMAATKPTAVLPAPEPQPITAVEAPAVPMDDTEQGLQEAIDARDLEKLSRWLSEVLLQGRMNSNDRCGFLKSWKLAVILVSVCFCRI